MLAIGSVQGGPEVAGTQLGAFVAKLMKAATEVRGDFKFGSSTALNVVFHIPGSVAPDPGYEGLRDGAFSRSQKLLMIQVAVPKEMVECQDADAVRGYVFDCLHKANGIAAKYFKKKDLEYSQPKFLSLVEALEGRL